MAAPSSIAVPQVLPVASASARKARLGSSPAAHGPSILRAPLPADSQAPVLPAAAPALASALVLVVPAPVDSVDRAQAALAPAERRLRVKRLAHSGLPPRAVADASSTPRRRKAR